MKEVISIGIGNCGLTVNETFFSEIANEHNLSEDGSTTKDFTKEGHYPHIYFDECQNGKYVSRSLMIDSDNSTIDNIRTGRNGKLFSMDNLCCGRKSTGGVFAKGMYGFGSDLVESSNEKLRKLVENCDRLNAFQMTFGLGGGSGSGIGGKFLSTLEERYPENVTMTFNVWPNSKC
jgi:hypothetical protein